MQLRDPFSAAQSSRILRTNSAICLGPSRQRPLFIWYHAAAHMIYPNLSIGEEGRGNISTAVLSGEAESQRTADAPRVEEGRDERQHVAEERDRLSDNERDSPAAKDDGHPGRPPEHGVLMSMPGALAEDLEKDGARSNERVQDTAACKMRERGRHVSHLGKRSGESPSKTKRGRTRQ